MRGTFERSVRLVRMEQPPVEKVRWPLSVPLKPVERGRI